MNNKTQLERLIAKAFRNQFGSSIFSSKKHIVDMLNDENHVFWFGKGGSRIMRWFSVVMLKPELVILCNNKPLPEHAVSQFWPQIISETQHEFEIGFHGSEVAHENMEDLSSDIRHFVESVAPPFKMPEDKERACWFQMGNYGLDEEPNWPSRAWSIKARSYWEENFGKLPITVHPQ